MSALKTVHCDLVELVGLMMQLASYALLFVCVFVSHKAKAAATVVVLRARTDLAGRAL